MAFVTINIYRRALHVCIHTCIYVCLSVCLCDILHDVYDTQLRWLRWWSLTCLSARKNSVGNMDALREYRGLVP